jgi:hypothetical protein
MIEIKAF